MCFLYIELSQNANRRCFSYMLFVLEHVIVCVYELEKGCEGKGKKTIAARFIEYV